MILGNNRRKYLADLMAKTTEFVISILVIGYLIAAKVNPEITLDLTYLLMAGALALILITIGTITTPDQ